MRAAAATTADIHHVNPNLRFTAGGRSTVDSPSLSLLELSGLCWSRGFAVGVYVCVCVAVQKKILLSG